MIDSLKKALFEIKRKSFRNAVKIIVFIREAVIFTLLIASLSLSAASLWISREFESATAEQIIFHLLMPINGAEEGVIKNFLINCAIVPFFIAALFYFLGHDFSKKKILQEQSGKQRFSTAKIWFAFRKPFIQFRYFLSVAIAVCSFTFIYFHSGLNKLAAHVYNEKEFSSFYEDNYVFLNKNQNIFRQDKRNLIVLYIESLESSFASIEEGGIFETGLIPEITQMAQANINFSHNNKIGGYKQLKGTNWTVAGLIATMCGVPLRIPFAENSYDRYKYFLPGAVCLTDILAANNYNISFLMGSQKNFAGVDIFLETHANISAKDLNYFRDSGKIKKDYHRGKWGVEDSKLYDLAKEELLNLSAQEEPFALFMMTIDTHMSDEFLDQRICEKNNERERKYIDVMRCASLQLNRFTKWISRQKFFKNTAVVVLGDHLSMNKKIFPKGKGRKVFNLFINSKWRPKKIKNRYFSHFDMFPTILAALGARLDNKGAALGRSLFHDEKTLLEKTSAKEVNENIMRRSKIYDCFLFKKNDSCRPPIKAGRS
ncbi:MAG: sulfatase-like hydrolase/transferase [Spirochaetia bacterium]|nr:sulfatase-like hydrolase/transferase [Spirochaetia bacterium]